MKTIPNSRRDPKGFVLKGHLQRTSATWMDRLRRREFRREDFFVEEQTITVKGLDATFDGYRIAHLTDIHLG